ncbi:oxygenase [Lithospermum erythrorhizon]|uniref:Oxygenase n=1 Tax=Lithospermum erythrorhizon TaxID=34254 RepID=A0AAV3S1G0_LITER
MYVGRETVAQYGDEVAKLCEKLLKILSVNLGLKEDALQEAFGGEEVGECLRVNYYPKCPQPGLTLGLSPHSDPGGMTLLLPDHEVPGLQVRRGDRWITVKPVPNAFIVNIGDQIQVISNASYKSVEHRVIVNSEKERVSLALFYNPKGDIIIKPSDELVGEDRPPLYPNMTYNEYRSFIRTRGPCGKSQLESLKSPR